MLNRETKENFIKDFLMVFEKNKKNGEWGTKLYMFVNVHVVSTSTHACGINKIKNISPGYLIS